jgi:hypothetical protein
MGNNILDESSLKEDHGEDDPSWWDEDSLLMAIDLGCDEGGSGDNLLVSVQLGVTLEARKMKNAWRSRLPKSLPYFHSVDFGDQTTGIFSKAGLDKSARQDLLDDLCGFIHTRLIAGLTVHISINQYNSLTTQPFRSRHGSAYSFAIDVCLLFGYHVATSRGMTPEFNILIENGHRNASHAIQTLQKIKGFSDHPKWEYYREDMLTDLRILSAGLGCKKDHPILQSADMLVYAEWQRRSHGDPAIWNSLIKRAIRYEAYDVRCDKDFIEGFAEEGSSEAIRKRWMKAKGFYEAEHGFSEIRSDDDDNSARRPESCEGRS